MELGQMRYVVKVAESGSINKAAKELCIGQSGLSKSLKDLETELGCRLFARTSGGVTLTKDGAEFLMYAQGILEQADHLASLYQPTSQRFELGKRDFCLWIPQIEEMSYATAAFQHWCRNYGKECSRIALNSNVSANIGSSSATSISGEIEESLALLAANKADLGIFRIKSKDNTFWERQIHSKGLHSAVIWQFKKIALMHAHHPLASRHAITFSDLKSFTEVINSQHREPSDGQIAVPNRVLQEICLKCIPGSYLLSSPLSEDTLIQENLKEKCITEEELVFPQYAPDLSYLDIAVWSGSLSDASRLFLEYLRQEIPEK